MVVAGSTVWVSWPVLPLWFAPPEYIASIAWSPTVRFEMASLTASPLPSTGTGAPKSDPSMVNWTVPSPGFGVTVAVKVTESPKTDGLTAKVTEVVVSALATTCVETAEVLVAWVAMPPYTAVMSWLPAVNEPIERVATADASTAPLPMTSTPS